MSTINIVTQSQEEKTPIAYTPFYFGNQVFVMAQQNTRRVENVVSFSFGVLTSNGQVIEIDPSLHSVLFNLMMSQVEQQANNRNRTTLIPIAQPSPVQHRLESKNTTDQEMDTSPFHFTCSKSTSSTELTSQNVDSSSRYRCRHCGNKKYILLDLDKSNNVRINEVLKVDVDKCSEKCLKLNAREQLKQKKIRFDDCIV